MAVFVYSIKTDTGKFFFWAVGKEIWGRGRGRVRVRLYLEKWKVTNKKKVRYEI